MSLTEGEVRRFVMGCLADGFKKVNELKLEVLPILSEFLAMKPVVDTKEIQKSYYKFPFGIRDVQKEKSVTEFWSQVLDDLVAKS